MKALVYEGVKELKVQSIPDPEILQDTDAIVKVSLSSVCGSDLHLLNGYVPTMKSGDVLGHEFIGEVVETGKKIKKIKKGDRVVVASVIGCGHCHYCRHDEWSLCDNTNPNAWIPEKLYGDTTAGIFGYSHAFGGFAGSHAEYIRVPFADFGAFPIPEGVSNDKAVFASDALPTGYMAADFCDIKKGDIVAVWGCGGVGQMAINSAYHLGAERVIAIDRIPDRLHLAQTKAKAEVLNFEDTDILEAIKEMTGGRGPDCCIDAVGMEAYNNGADYYYDKLKQTLRLQTDRPTALRQTIQSCRKGGVVSVVGVYAGLIDKFPMGALMNKALTIRAGQMHAQRYIPHLLDLLQQEKLDSSYLLTHKWDLQRGAEGYKMFNDKKDNCMRVVFEP
ncbi:MAG: glutathione-dependent formaldehyde dehydrogenase [Cyclobacteriaceae bacterium]|nr:glutathione-dependent formaldehyde dehydrogenase [Cyclobacteriaceae bacterium]